MIRGALLLAVLVASPLAAQSIPMPFAAEMDTRQISVTVTPDRSTMRGLPTELRDARRRMQARQVVSDDHLRRLAAYGDGLAAQKYVRLLVGRGEAQSAASDVAYHAAIAVGAGRVWTLPEMVEAMRHLSPATEPTERIRKYIQVLYPHAWAGNALALQAVVDFNGEGRLFGALSNATRDRILAQSAQTGDGRIELRMALALMEQDNLTDRQRQEAETLLVRARETAHPGIRAAAENMLRQLTGQDAADG
ncbi:hypothetical protein [Thetidibacter halocola]|uniref:HEAT repeat domain-containing protein n=1 Tax=Thetidibacter halocola TaxID=2827239 RepID=A0A8J7W9J2_9RHOB|nr:hypothetical protein [Thetidibacter halocola]MBS0123412.1 hypothetical protein [Thetidibacter halocola]